MYDDTEEWQELCRRAAAEQNPKTLVELSEKIIELFKMKQNRLGNQSDQEKGST